MPFSTLLSIVLLFSFSVKAEDDISSKAIDTNQDNKVDRIENFKNGDLISVARDTKYNGTFDETSYYYPYESPTKPTEVIEKDTDGDGKVDRIEKVYRNPTADLMVRTFKVTSRRGPASESYEKTWTKHSKLSQLAKNPLECSNPFSLENLAIIKLSEDVSSVRYSLDKGYYKTGWGYNIHQSCMDKWGATEFPNTLKSSMTTGLQCLERLSKDNIAKNPTKPNGAYRNLKELGHMLETKPITVTCNETNFQGNELARASASVSDNVKGDGLKHPFISVNPKQNALDGKTDLLGATLFHEQFHSIGITHDVGIEYAESCSTCCISKYKKGATENACKVCAGAYTNASDKNYLKDIIAAGKTSPELKEGSEMAVLNYMKEFPEDRYGLFAYADAVSGPVGAELAKILKQKFPNATSEEKAMLASSAKNSTRVPQAAENFSKLIAEAHFNLYFEKNPKKVLADLKKETSQIKQLLTLESFATGKDKSIYTALAEKLRNQLFDMYLNDYPSTSTAENAQAYKMLVEVGFIKG